VNPRVRSVKPLPNYKLELEFENSEVREFDLKPYLDKGVFRELKNPNYFSNSNILHLLSSRLKKFSSSPLADSD
jgi:hypothetical protein